MTIEKHERSTKDLVKAAVSGWLGTALEFMDFQLYSLGAALVFHEIFFPESSTAMALILAMGTYGAGYVARIVGAFIFGKMGDRLKGISLFQDKVIPYSGVIQALGQECAASHISLLDFPYRYEHEQPFPVSEAHKPELINRSFLQVFNTAAGFLA